MNESTTKCLIVDDEPLAVRVIQSHLEKITDMEVAATCHSALDAFDVLRRQSIDLVFLDIQMPELTGIEFIKALDRPPSFIFTTAYRDYALDGFELDAIDYLLKPVSLPRLLKAIDKYRRQSLSRPGTNDVSHARGNQQLTVRANRQNVNVQLDEILYIESLSDYTKIHTTKTVLVCRERISHLEDRLASEGFLRIHRSFIVPVNRVTSFTAEEVTIGTQSLSISRSYRQKVRERLSK